MVDGRVCKSLKRGEQRAVILQREPQTGIIFELEASLGLS